MTFSKHLSHCQTPVKRLILGLFDSKSHHYVAFLTACHTVTQFSPLFLDNLTFYIYIRPIRYIYKNI